MAEGGVRFGRLIEDLPEQLEFGDWGVLGTAAALDVFADTLAYFDQEDVIKAEKGRFEMIRAARRYYDGNHVKPLKVRVGEPDDNVITNLCRSLIDDAVSWLFGNPETGVLKMDTAGAEGTAVVEDTADAEDTAEGDIIGDDYGGVTGSNDKNKAEEGRLLEQVYEESGGFDFFKRLGTRGAVAGHSFIKLIPRENNLPKMIVLDPQLCTVRTDPVDATKVLAYKIEWQRMETDAYSRRKDNWIYRQLVARVDDEAWVVGDFKCKDRRKRDWQLVEAWAWPWKWSPVTDCPNVMAGWGYYGLSDLEDAAGLNDSINFLVSNTLRILKIHAHPKTVGTGFTASDLQETSIESFWTVENPDADIWNLEMQSDLGSSWKLLDFLRVSFWTIGRGLDPSIYKDKIGQITNFALRVLAIRTLHKMGDKRLAYGKALRAINSHILEMTGRPTVNTIIQWPDPMPEDPRDLLERLDREVAMGITSKQTAAEKAGRSWIVERARIKIEKKEQQSLGQFLLDQFDRGGEPFGAGPGSTTPATDSGDDGEE